MTKILLNEVFKTNGIPTYTFVQPNEYTKLKSNLQTPGRSLIIEGPSGIGKTTAVENAIADAGLDSEVLKLTARRREDVELIRELPNIVDPGVVIIDDFHKLDDAAKEEIANYVKINADSENKSAKLIIVGINNAGQSLIDFAPDLVNRIDIIEFERNSDEKVEEIISLGSRALNIELPLPEDIIRISNGSFYLCQMLCNELCLAQEVLEQQDCLKKIDASIESVRADVWKNIERRFGKPCRDFCRGNRFRRAGRAPYFHILKSLAESGEWLLRVKEYERQNPEMRNSISEVITKGHLVNLIKESHEISALLHYDERSQTLIVEDPQFVFFIQNIPWKSFADEIGFTNIEIPRRYDFALSFAGEVRVVAQKTFEELTAMHFEVFYDKNEQARLLAEDVETYLEPIYRSEAKYVIVFLSQDYSRKLWTRFEQKTYESRVVAGEVIPVLVDDFDLGSFSSIEKVGHFRVSSDNLDHDIPNLCRLLEEKMNNEKIMAQV